MDQRELPVFEDAAAWWRPAVNLVDPGLDPVRVPTIEVSGNLLELLGVRTQVGPGFPEGGPLFSTDELVAVISDRLWHERYGADPALIGRQLDLNGSVYTVLGVMPPGFHYPDDVDVWQRLRWDMTQHSRSAHFMEAVARLAPGTTLEQAQAAADTLARRIEEEHNGTRDSPGVGWGARLIPLLDEQLGYYQPALIVLFGAVGLLLLIGVLNVASLFLTRALARGREIAVRTALGASPRQLASQLVCEALVLSAAGAALGVAAAAVALPLLARLVPVAIPRLDEARLDPLVLGVALGIAAGTTLFFGLLPSLFLLRGQPGRDLKAGERGSRGARRVYSVLVASEVALACALLVVSGLLIRTVGEMMSTPTGVSADEVVTTRVQLARDGFPEWERVGETHARLLERIREQPSVIAAGSGNFLPFEVGWRGPFSLRGRPAPARIEDAPQAQLHSVSEGWFEALGARFVAGRGFEARDQPDAPGVAVVNETFARRYLADADPLGQVVQLYAAGIGPLGRNLQFQSDLPLPYEVVGILADVRNAPLGQSVEPAIYCSARQFPFRELVVAVRASDRAAAVAAVRGSLAEVAPRVPMAVVRTWGDHFAARTAEPRLLMAVLTFFGAIAAFLAALGVYGLFSWSVAMRSRELAIRLALGARPSALGRLVLVQSLVLVAVGLVSGLVVVRSAEGALSRVLFQVTPDDPGTALLASAVLLAAAVAACAPAARRAARVDPVEGLRAE
jgi:predicted permease